jgi:hypothetical protein
LKKQNIHYVQFDIQKITSDPDYMIMSPLERGLYLPVILMLFSNSGSLPFNNNLYRVFNFENETQFLETWEKIKHKFKIRNKKIYSAYVSNEIRRIKELTQFYAEQGFKGARKRWAGHKSADNSNSPPIAKENETKGNEITEHNTKENEDKSSNNQVMENDETRINVPDNNLHSDSTSSLSRSSNSVRSSSYTVEQDTTIKNIEKARIRFLDRLNHILAVLTRSDRTAFNNICDYLADGCRNGKFNIDIFERALDLAKEARNGQNPNALFMSRVRKELGYKKHPPEDKKQNIVTQTIEKFGKI